MMIKTSIFLSFALATAGFEPARAQTAEVSEAKCVPAHPSERKWEDSQKRVDMLARTLAPILARKKATTACKWIKVHPTGVECYNEFMLLGMVSMRPLSWTVSADEFEGTPFAIAPSMSPEEKGAFVMERSCLGLPKDRYEQGMLYSVPQYEVMSAISTVMFPVLQEQHMKRVLESARKAFSVPAGY